MDAYIKPDAYVSLGKGLHSAQRLSRSSISEKINELRIPLFLNDL